MSKYIKLNSAIRILWELCMPQCDYERGAKQLESLPTIEVSEEQLSKLQASENSVENTTASEYFTSISRANSKLEVSEEELKGCDKVDKRFSEDAISRQQAIEILCRSRCGEIVRGCPAHSCPIVEKYDNLPSVAPSVIPKTQIETQNLNENSNEDAISREWVSVNMLKYGFHAPDMTVGEFLENAPSVIPKPKEGEWQTNDNTYAGSMQKNWKCTNCCDGLYDFICTSSRKPNWNYCPRCGAKMKGAEE